MKKIGIVDRPNKDLSKDLLNIYPHAESLSIFIKQCDSPITIGIQGEWGSGKTSLMYLIQNSLKEKDSSDHKVLSVWINAWEHSLFSSPQDILFKVLSDLVNQILPHTSKPAQFGDNFKKRMKSIATGTMKFASLALVGEGGDRVVGDMLNFDNNNIKKTRQELEQLTSGLIDDESPIQKIVVYIDDLDRIDPVDAVSLLELLKNVFDIDNCVFVLAIDYEIVVKGLKEKFGQFSDDTGDSEFRAYFDKIIQLPFMMPIGQYDIGRYVRSLLIETGFLEEEQRYDAEIKEILSYTIGGNPRSLKRLVNSLSLIDIFAKVRDDIDDIEQEEDLLLFALICMQIEFPKIYSVLVDNSDFRKWNQKETAFTVTKKKEEKNKDRFLEDFRIASLSDEFNEEWEKALFRICYNDNRLKKYSTNISRLLSFIDKNILSDKNQKETTEWIEKVVQKTLVTNVKRGILDIEEA